MELIKEITVVPDAEVLALRAEVERLDKVVAERDAEIVQLKSNSNATHFVAEKHFEHKGSKYKLLLNGLNHNGVQHDSDSIIADALMRQHVVDNGLAVKINS